MNKEKKTLKDMAIESLSTRFKEFAYATGAPYLNNLARHYFAKMDEDSVFYNVEMDIIYSMTLDEFADRLTRFYLTEEVYKRIQDFSHFDELFQNEIMNYIKYNLDMEDKMGVLLGYANITNHVANCILKFYGKKILPTLCVRFGAFWAVLTGVPEGQEVTFYLSKDLKDECIAVRYGDTIQFSRAGQKRTAFVANKVDVPFDWSKVYWFLSSRIDCPPYTVYMISPYGNKS